MTNRVTVYLDEEVVIAAEETARRQGVDADAVLLRWIEIGRHLNPDTDAALRRPSRPDKRPPGA